jgi:hypothetical protein
MTSVLLRPAAQQGCILQMGLRDQLDGGALAAKGEALELTGSGHRSAENGCAWMVHLGETNRDVGVANGGPSKVAPVV